VPGASAVNTRNPGHNQLGNSNSAGTANSKVAMARKLQFYTSNNFYPNKQLQKRSKYDQTEN